MDKDNKSEKLQYLEVENLEGFFTELIARGVRVDATMADGTSVLELAARGDHCFLGAGKFVKYQKALMEVFLKAVKNENSHFDINAPCSHAENLYEIAEKHENSGARVALEKAGAIRVFKVPNQSSTKGLKRKREDNKDRPFTISLTADEENLFLKLPPQART